MQKAAVRTLESHIRALNEENRRIVQRSLDIAEQLNALGFIRTGPGLDDWTLDPEAPLAAEAIQDPVLGPVIWRLADQRSAS